MKIKGYISKSELNWWIKADINKHQPTPIILEIWKDKKDMRECSIKGSHLKEVEIEISFLANK